MSDDLEAIWEAHCRYEFETRDLDATMATMVAEPYVNHIPTMTGGTGYEQLKRFYKNHFIGAHFATPNIQGDTGRECNEAIVQQRAVSAAVNGG